jgi:hypothetical protein
MSAVQTPSYYLLAVATVLVNISVLGVVAYQYAQFGGAAALAATTIAAFSTVWGIAALAVVAKARTSKQFGTASVLVLLTALVSLGGAVAAGYTPEGAYQGVGTSLFTVLVIMYLVLSFVVSEAMLQALRRRRS